MVEEQIVIGLKEMQIVETLILKNVVEICEKNDIDYYFVCGSALGVVRHQGPIPWDSDTDIGIPYYQIENFISCFDKDGDKRFHVESYTKDKSYHKLFPRVTVKGADSTNLHVDVFSFVGLPNTHEEQLEFSKTSDNFNKQFKLKKFKGYKQSSPIIKIARFFITNFYPKSANKLYKDFDAHCMKYDYEKSKYVMNPCGHYGMKNVIEKTLLGKGIKKEYSGFMVNIPEKYDEYLKHYYGDYMKYPSEEVQRRSDNITVAIPKSFYKEVFENV